MKHGNRTGRCILDKDMKFIKKLLKKNPISFSGRYHRDNDCVMEVVGVRKYVASPWRTTDKTRFCYEVDIFVKLSNKNILNYSGTKHKNSRVRRYMNEEKLLQELVYFNVSDIQISKITFEK
jgi:hypothetical protein